MKFQTLLNYVLVASFLILISCSSSYLSQTHSNDTEEESFFPSRLFEKAENAGDLSLKMLHMMEFQKSYLEKIGEVFAKYEELKAAGSFESKSFTVPSIKGSLRLSSLSTSAAAPTTDELVKLAEANGAWITARANDYARMADSEVTLAEAQKMRASAVGEGLLNMGKHLDNVQKVIENNLLAKYLEGYASYTKTNKIFMKLRANLYAKTDRAGKAVIRTVTKNLNYADQQADRCVGQASQMASLNSQEGIRERSEAQIVYNNLGSFFNQFLGDPNGEKCLNRMLLSSHSEADALLYNLQIQVTKNQQPVGLYCGETSKKATEYFAGDSWQEDLAVYKFPLAAQYKGERVGLYRPRTMWQLAKLVTDSSHIATIQAPAAESLRKNECDRDDNPANSTTQHNYAEIMKQYEQELLSMYKIEDEKVFGGFGDYQTVSYYKYDVSMANGNLAYKSLLSRLKAIGDSTRSCIDHQKAERLRPVESPVEESPVVESGGDVGGQSISSIIAGIINPVFPSSMAALKSCVNLAELHRKNAYANLALLEDVNKQLKDLYDTPAPPPPAPVFSPIEAKVGSLMGSGLERK